MLVPTPTLEAEDRRVLDEVEAMWQRLRAHVQATPDWTGQLRRELFAAAVQGSNTIERITVSMSDARAAVEGQTMSAEVNPVTGAAIRGYRDALTYVQQAPYMHFFTYDEMLLSALHFMIQKYDLAKWPGRYRPGPIYASSANPRKPAYTGPSGEKVPGLMRELLEWLNQGDLGQPPMVRAAMAHLHLVRIHPWRDGNGRTARCLHTLVLAREGFLAPEFSSIEEWLGYEVNTAGYYLALQSMGEVYDPTVDCREWLRFALTAHHQQAQTVQAWIEYTEELWRALADVAEERGLPPRVVKALYGAVIGELRRTTYQSDAGISRDQAIRDIQALVRHGLLRPQGNAATRVYLMDGVARQVHEECMDMARSPMVDPYRSVQRRRSYAGSDR